jgi:hypothetical protein
LISANNSALDPNLRNRALLGDSRNGRLAATLGWVTVALMTAAAIAILISLTGV